MGNGGDGTDIDENDSRSNHDLVINGDSSDSSEDEGSHLLDSQRNSYSVTQTTAHTITVVNDYSTIIEHTGNQHSIITIFSMWNTMMGTSLLSMPWTIKQAGFINGIILLVLMAGIMAYTSYRVLKVCRYLGGNLVEFSDAVKCYLGHITESVAVICSLLTLLGGCIVYWILMSNFLYHIGIFIYSYVQADSLAPNASFLALLSLQSDATCYNKTEIVIYDNNLFAEMWNETKYIPLYLIAVIFPFINLKSPTFFTKFNAFGTLSVTYLIVFVLVKASQWGINIDFNKSHEENPSFSQVAEWTFPALTGVAALAYLLQNAVISIVRNQKYPENNATVREWERILCIICGCLCCLALVLFIDNIVYIWTHYNYRMAMVTSSWLVGLSPVLTLVAFVAMLMPKIFVFRDVAMSVCLSVVMYKFLEMLVALGNQFDSIRNEIIHHHRLHFNVRPLCCLFSCLPTAKLTKTNFRVMKILVLQHPILIVLITLITMVTWLDGTYVLGKWDTGNPFPYLSALRVASVLTAIYVLSSLVTLCQDAMRIYENSIYCMQMFLVTVYNLFYYRRPLVQPDQQESQSAVQDGNGTMPEIVNSIVSPNGQRVTDFMAATLPLISVERQQQRELPREPFNKGELAWMSRDITWGHFTPPPVAKLAMA
ncbi:hypothetical protein Btru_040634 [Bulinus truncatus]|nr:hypothetical protein Btru_040634 [Bulinus truncatus]